MKGPCPCGTGEEYNKCCAPFIENKMLPDTAEQTMRSRYVAYVLNDMDYIESTHHPKTVKEFDKKESADWSENAQWLGLEILNTDKGEKEDSEGIVEFACQYEWDGKEKTHHEISEFKKKDGKWYFYDAKLLGQPIERAEPKVGRNDPCPCGSGKKFKKCCLN